MNKHEILDILYELCQLDIDAVSAYDQALKHISDSSVYAQIANFQHDHIQHIEHLNILIAKYEGTPLKKQQDLKGYLIESYTALRSITGLNGALKAMETNEIVTNRQYLKMLEENPMLPMDVQELLAKNYGDEKHHLAFIRKTLSRLAHAA